MPNRFNQVQHGSNWFNIAEYTVCWSLEVSHIWISRVRTVSLTSRWPRAAFQLCKRSGSWCVTELDSLCTAINQRKSPQINWYSNARKRDGNGSHCIRATWRSSTSASPVASPTPAMAPWRCDYKALPSSLTKGGFLPKDTQRHPRFLVLSCMSCHFLIPSGELT